MKNKFRTMISSATGLLLAFVVIILFLLAAKYLKCVIFGLILAYFLLPLQEWYEEYVIRCKAFFCFSKLLYIVFFPIIKPIALIKAHMQRRTQKEPMSDKDLQAKKESKILNYSCILTVVSVLLFLSIFFTTISWLSTYAFASLTKSVSNWAMQTTKDYEAHINHDSKNIIQQQIDQNAKNEEAIQNNQNNIDLPNKDLLRAIVFKLESFKPKIESSPLFKSVKIYVLNALNNSENFNNLVLRLLNKGGGVFSYTTDILKTIFKIVLTIVFTFFFFAFFLYQMARFRNKMADKVTTGEYIIDGILSTKWFPSIKLETQKNAIEILDNIIAKLKVWVRGYLTIIIIETIYYEITFLLVGVPYSYVLGLLAGMTILLPYIGSSISAILTILACLIFGSGSPIQILIIIALYIMMNGILEQLFIYPAVIGTALGLNEFETIIIVLLGGLIAGIPGFIFAVPTASILKYLIPQIYNIWPQEEKTPALNEN